MPHHGAGLHTLGGLLSTTGPLLLPGIRALAAQIGPLRVIPWAEWSLALGLSLLLVTAGWLWPRRPRAARRLTAACLFGATAVGGWALSGDPVAAFAFLLAIGVLGATLLHLGHLPERVEQAGSETLELGMAAGSSATIGLVGCWLHAEALVAGPAALLPLAATLLTAFAHGTRWLARARRETSTARWRFVAPLVLAASALSLCAVPRVAVFLAAVQQLWVLVLVLSGPRGPWRTLASIADNASAFLVVTFGMLCVVGGAVLGLDFAARTGSELSTLDAFFTAVSATCVTGLIVVDTPVAFGPAGQAVILVLMQLGGLGVMAFSAAAMFVFAGRMSLRAEATAAEILPGRRDQRLAQLVRDIFLVTAFAEILGALVLTVRFCAHGDPWATALWRGVFTSISAFCNAGFALQSDSLVPYQHDAVVVTTVGVLIVGGGLGAPLIASLPAWRRMASVALGARLAVWTSGILMAGSTLLIAGVEWNRSLSHLGGFAKLLNAWFQAVTLRTAGFNSVDLAAMHPATHTLMMPLMFVGGSPGSTAGGIKTTTAALLVLVVVAALRGEANVRVFHRQVGQRTVLKAAALATIGLLVVLAAFLGLQLTQALPARAGLFEVFSALGTVGLSLGATARLDAVGKLLIIACMFLGRVGPLSLFMLLTSQQREGGWTYPEEDVQVG